MKMILAAIAACCCLGLGAQDSSRENSATVSPMFASHAVFAKNKPIRVFGSGNAKVEVALAGKTAATTGKDGKWSVELPAMKAGGPYELTVKLNGAEHRFTDVWVGTVVMVAGQSNFQFKLKESSTPREKWQSCAMVRSYTVDRPERGEPHKAAEGWIPLQVSDAGNWSAVGYHLALELHRRTGEAIGVVNCYQGASAIQPWMPAAVAGEARFALPKKELHWDIAYYSWNRNGYLWDYMLLKFAPYSMSHVAWYQGESNTGSGEWKVYAQEAAAMVKSWRELFKDPSLGFTMVQIANLKGRGDAPGWKNLQRVQMDIPKLIDGVKVVASADVCEDDNIHPRTKDKLAKRIAEAALPAINR